MPGKVFARIILDGVCHHLLEYQHSEQTGMTPMWSTIDHIPALQVLTKHKQELWQGLLTADVDLCKTFVFFSSFGDTVEHHMRANKENVQQGEQETRGVGAGRKKVWNRDMSRSVEGRRKGCGTQGKQEGQHRDFQVLM